MRDTFYDLHTHVMSLNHPNLIEFIKRNNLGPMIALLTIPGVDKLFVKLKYKRFLNAMNLLSLMEHSIGDYIKRLEEDIIDSHMYFEGEGFDKMLITPLMMDFGNKYSKKFNPYYSLESKPIIDQTIDLFNGIKYFKEIRPETKLEVYPFLGLTPSHYTYDYLKKHIVDKYFSTIPLVDRRNYFKEHMGSFNGDLDSLGNFSFLGIKVYPPLGFDPWPDDPEERNKVKLIYDVCVEKNIPIMCHCGYSSYTVLDKGEMYKLTNPERWKHVLYREKYRKLKVCFAHFGGEFNYPINDPWRNTIAELAVEFDNIYFDIGARCYNDRHYRNLNKCISKLAVKHEVSKDKLFKRLLFGSDVMMCLLTTKSYKSYLDTFKSTKCLTEKEKVMMCAENPERFLFGD